MSVSNYMHTFLRALSNPYIEYRDQITYLQLHTTAHVTGFPTSQQLVARNMVQMEVELIPRIVVLDGMDLLGTIGIELALSGLHTG